MLEPLMQDTETGGLVLSIPAERRQMDAVISFINAALEGLGYEEKLIRKIDVAADELFTNICDYAYSPGKGDVTIRCGVQNGMAFVQFEDEGRAYNPLERKDPDVTLPVEERPIGGLGIFLVKKLMDEMHYSREDGKNIVIIRKKQQ